MFVHSPNQYLFPAQTWCDAARWWKVSRCCLNYWRFYKCLNVSWRSTPDFAGGWFEIPMFIQNNNQLQLLDGKGIKQRPLVSSSALYGHGRSFVPVWKVKEAYRCENSTILSQISPVVDLHEETGTITQQIITNTITLSLPRLQVCIRSISMGSNHGEWS